MGAREVIAVLAALIAKRQSPSLLRSENGPEFIAHAIQDWLAATGIDTAYIAPGSPWENAYVESFHSRLRDEFLDRELFASLPEAKLLAIEYRAGYNQHRPHSSLGYLTPVEFAAAQHHSGFAAPSILPTAGLRAPLRLREAAHQPQPTLISSGT